MNVIQSAIDWFNQSRFAFLLKIEAVRYLISGGIAFAVQLIVLIFLVELFSVNEVLATAIGFLCATPVNYTIQKVFVFKSQASVGKSFVVYCLVTLATMAMNVQLFYLLLEYIGLHYIISQVFTTCLIVVLNYFVNRHLTFSQVLK